MKSRRKNRFSTVIFFLPFILIGGVVAYLFVLSIEPGTLIIQALTSDQYAPSRTLNVSYKVAGMTGNTPAQISIQRGVYNVTFESLPWYDPPAPRTVAVPSGQTVYADMVYSPTTRTILITYQGFSIYRTTAKSGLTPVIWKNTINQTVTITCRAFPDKNLQPGQSYTFIFPLDGFYQYIIAGTRIAGNLTVV